MTKAYATPLALALLLFIIPAVASGQSIGIGARIIGPQLSNFTNNIGVYRDPSNNIYKNTAYFGLLAGLSYRKQIKEQHYFQVELLYTMRGEQHSYKTSTLNGSTVSNLGNNQSASLEYYLQYRTNYIEIPILYTIDLSHNASDDAPAHIFLSVGLAAGINVVSKLTQNSFSARGSFLYSPVDENLQETPVKANPLLLSAVTDIEAEFRRHKPTRYFFYARFNGSITNVYGNNIPNMATKVITPGLGIGIRRELNF